QLRRRVRRAGKIIEMSPIGTKHAICVSNLSELLTLKTIQFAHVRQQNPVHLSALAVYMQILIRNLLIFFY
ncbi:MAG: hypothetical protein WCQ26_05475, partial [Pseudanabaena sp. ELA748]